MPQLFGAVSSLGHRCALPPATQRDPSNPPMLLFKKKFLDAIRSGEKTQTIRLWKHRMMRDGQRSYIPGVGYIRITLVQAVELGELDEDDARRDGFASAEALRIELQTLYSAKLSAGHQAYRVTFRVLPADEQKK